MPFGVKRKVKPSGSKGRRKKEKYVSRLKYKLHKKTADIISGFFMGLLFFIIIANS